MNEKIRQLVEKAPYTTVSTEGRLFTQQDLAKFAELIVEECIERVGRQYTPVRDSTIEGRPNPFHPDLRVRTEYEQGFVKCGVDSTGALYELIQESTDRWYKENILRDEE